MLSRSTKLITAFVRTFSSVCYKMVLLVLKGMVSKFFAYFTNLYFNSIIDVKKKIVFLHTNEF